MVKFDCDEYWLRTVWDRTRELARQPEAVRNEFLLQEGQFLSAITSIVGSRGKLAIADLGSGPGHIAEAVLKACGERIQLTLVDLNPAALSLAQGRLGKYPNTRFFVGSAMNAGNEFTGAFDLVYTVDILHHLSDLPEAVRSISKTLAPKGIFLANVFAADTYQKWDRLKYGMVRSFWRRISSNLANRVYRRLPTRCQRWIRARGLGRIAPLTKEQVEAVLGTYFHIQIERLGYYYFYTRRTEGTSRLKALENARRRPPMRRLIVGQSHVPAYSDSGTAWKTLRESTESCRSCRVPLRADLAWMVKLRSAS